MSLDALRILIKYKRRIEDLETQIKHFRQALVDISNSEKTIPGAKLGILRKRSHYMMGVRDGRHDCATMAKKALETPAETKGDKA